MTATAPKRKAATQTKSGASLEDQIEDLKAELRTVNLFLQKVQTFSNVVGDAKAELAKLKEQEHKQSEALRETRDQIRSLKDMIDSSDAKRNSNSSGQRENRPNSCWPIGQRLCTSTVPKSGRQCC